MSEVKKKLNLSSHSMGNNCQCALQYLNKVPDQARLHILKGINMMDSIDLQNRYLCGLISLLSLLPGDGLEKIA